MAETRWGGSSSVFLAPLLPVLLVGCAVTINGCAGPGAQQTGGLRLRVTFPEADGPKAAASGSGARLVPLACQSISVTVTNASTGELLFTTTPPLTPSAPEREVNGLPTGMVCRVTATAYPTTDATGTPQAVGAVDVTIPNGTSAPVGLTLSSTIVRVAVTPSPLKLSKEAQLSLIATAFDASNQVVLLGKPFLWSSSIEAVATVDTSGTVTGRSVQGTCSITARERESGVEGIAYVTVGRDPVGYRFDRFIGSPPSAARFWLPSGIAVGTDGSIHIVDSGFAETLVTDAAGRVGLRWSFRTLGADAYVTGLALTPSGIAYIADWVGHRVAKVSSSGAILTTWGSRGAGPGEFESPAYPAVDALGNVYVADVYNHRIQKFDADGNFLVAWGSLGAGPGQFNNPQGIAVDSSGYIYVGDEGNRRVQKLAPDGSPLAVWGESGSGEGQFGNIAGLAVSASGVLYVGDRTNRHVAKFDTEGHSLGQLGSSNPGPDQLLSPRAVAVDAQGAVYVCDIWTGLVKKFAPDGQVLCVFGTPNAADGELWRPMDVWADTAGNVIVADTGNQRVQVFRQDGTFVRKWGSQGEGSGQFSTPDNPASVAVDANGNVYAEDFPEGQIHVYTREGSYLRSVGSKGTGDGQFNASCGGIAVGLDGFFYTCERTIRPVQRFGADGAFLAKMTGTTCSLAVATNAAGNIFLDGVTPDRSQGIVAEYQPNGTLVRQWNVGRMSWDLAVDAAGRVYVVNSPDARVEVYAPDGALLFNVGQRGDGPGDLDHPSGISLDSGGNLYVADSYNHRIQRFVPVY